jgi:hypothetical protein
MEKKNCDNEIAVKDQDIKKNCIIAIRDNIKIARAPMSTMNKSER